MKRLSLPNRNADLLLILLAVLLCFNVLLGYLSQTEWVREEPSVIGTCQGASGPSVSMCLVLTGDQTDSRHYLGRYCLEDGGSISWSRKRRVERAVLAFSGAGAFW